MTTGMQAPVETKAHNDAGILDDDQLDQVQGGSGLLDVAKLVVKTLDDLLRIGSGRPQV